MEHIPKFFWYCVSISLLATTFVVLFLAWNSSTLKIQFADVKVDIQTAAQSAQSYGDLSSSSIESMRRIEMQWKANQISDNEAVKELISLVKGLGSQIEEKSKKQLETLKSAAGRVSERQSVLF